MVDPKDLSSHPSTLKSDNRHKESLSPKKGIIRRADYSTASNRVTIPANKAELTDKNHDTISLNDSYNQHVSQESFGNKQNYNYSNSNESSNHQGSTWSSSSTEECPSEAVVDVIIHQNIPTLSNPIKHGWEKAAKFHSQTPSQNSKTHHTSKSQPWSIHHAHGRHQSAPTLNTRNA
eukprot:CAMPEP_0184857698 /NCGR_PEP_ID=MMETSP0580-20130426/2850_1 /TAXON_ID=1118495 /ORGANISM="Dactyliosolen fragilissimus" /LENGTH=176 /DNA_ID=CAMNT_0027353439 /DNA_START=1005 /DNA_END=1533 /DNA_ORIENTATION=-